MLWGCEQGKTPETDRPSPDDAPLVAAWAANGRGDRALALDLFLEAARANPGRLAPWTGALALSDSDDERKRIRTLFETLNAGDGSLPWQILQAALTPDAGRREQRLMEFVRQGREPQTALASYFLGELLLARGNAPAAIRRFQDALSRDPSEALAFRGLARALIAHDRLNDALPHGEAWLRIHPDDGVMHYNLGCIHLQRRQDPERASEAFARARKTLPKDLEVLLASGAAALSLDPPDTILARDCLQDALGVAPRSPKVRWNLAVLYGEHLGDAEAARRHLEAYLSLGGEDESRARSWLEELKREAKR